MSPPKTTPMISQYLSIKGQYPDAVLFYRMGDFYEMFFEDAERAAGILDIALTSRNKNVDKPIPMCGVPHKAAQSYIARLLDAGLKVAVCDQVEDPATAKGLVKSYGHGPDRVQVLQDLNLDLLRGEMVAITGVSGTGKSGVKRPVFIPGNFEQQPVHRHGIKRIHHAAHHKNVFQIGRIGNKKGHGSQNQ